jgi:putative copper export protein
MEILAKAATYLGFVLAVGAGVVGVTFPDAVPAARRRRIAVGTMAGAALVVAGGLGEAWWLLERITRGRTDGNLFFGYLTDTRHGVAVLVRVAIAAVVTALAARRTALPLPGVMVAVPVALAWLASAAAVGHSGAMGTLPAVASLAHLVAVSLWAGALLQLSLAAAWGGSALPIEALRRLGRIGLAALVTLAVSGFLMTRLHLQGEGAWASSYGAALTLKLVLVAATVALAGLARFVLLRAVERQGGRRLALAVRIESALLALVLVATAVVATRPPVHGP